MARSKSRIRGVGRVKPVRITIDAVAVGKRIARARLSIGGTQLWLARKIGVKSKSQISEFENGRRLPDLLTLACIAVAVRRSLEFLLWALPTRSALYRGPLTGSVLRAVATDVDPAPPGVAPCG